VVFLPYDVWLNNTNLNLIDCNMKKLIWANSKSPTKEQVRSLERLGQVTYLKDIDKELLKATLNVELESDLYPTAEALILLTIKHNSYLVEPDGTSAFQNSLGFYNKTKEGKLRITIFYAYPKTEWITL